MLQLPRDFDKQPRLGVPVLADFPCQQLSLMFHTVRTSEWIIVMSLVKYGPQSFQGIAIDSSCLGNSNGTHRRVRYSAFFSGEDFIITAVQESDMAQATHWSRVGTGTKALSQPPLEPRDLLLRLEMARPPACSAPLRTAVCKTQGPLCPLRCGPAPNEKQHSSSNKIIRKEVTGKPLGFRRSLLGSSGKEGRAPS